MGGAASEKEDVVSAVIAPSVETGDGTPTRPTLARVAAGGWCVALGLVVVMVGGRGAGGWLGL